MQPMLQSLTNFMCVCARLFHRINRYKLINLHKLKKKQTNLKQFNKNNIQRWYF
ncbi:hypothetical protein Hesp067 [Hemileuca sp. nucleopolyhedrovirus]|uniref:Uncharacterized protein n=1 Tax=Hemileuca sp. nucleopolyhedrovirus TaxID=1367203 RepID=S5MQD2_9ABAC|nr:hypothetical protein Hesp067 [Hemileuca sp. nucleopolyhedrovirus]AGR56819.1 hypothetical protein Hesp067 [Hemileuca sp. nucleopolyhedrovirus]